MEVWNGMTQPELDREYSPSSRAPGFEAVLAEYRSRGDRARAALPSRLDLSYGPHPAERLDVFPAAGPGAPMVVFVHGGHWQEGSKEDGAFAAEPLATAGFAFCAVGYGLAPQRSLGEMVGSVRRCLGWLAAHAGRFGSDPAKLYVAGSSAGAHLLAAALGRPRPGEAAMRDVMGACLLSGVYDLEPVRHSYVNDRVGLDAAQARDLSLAGRLPLAARQVILARGELETAEYARQQDSFAQALTASGQPPTSLVIAGRNHFDVVFDLADERTVLGAAVGRQLRPVRAFGPRRIP